MKFVTQEKLDGVPIRFSTLLIQLLHGLCTTFPYLSYDLLCDMTYDFLLCDCDLCETCDMTLSYTPSCIVSPKEKKKQKEI